jgi:hypothetical protein
MKRNYAAEKHKETSMGMTLTRISLAFGFRDEEDTTVTRILSINATLAWNSYSLQNRRSHALVTLLPTSLT